MRTDRGRKARIAAVQSPAPSPQSRRAKLRSGESRENEERKVDQLRAGQRRALGRSAKRQ